MKPQGLTRTKYRKSYDQNYWGIEPSDKEVNISHLKQIKVWYESWLL